MHNPAIDCFWPCVPVFFLPCVIVALLSICAQQHHYCSEMAAGSSSTKLFTASSVSFQYALLQSAFVVQLYDHYCILRGKA